MTSVHRILLVVLSSAGAVMAGLAMPPPGHTTPIPDHGDAGDWRWASAPALGRAAFAFHWPGHLRAGERATLGRARLPRLLAPLRSPRFTSPRLGWPAPVPAGISIIEEPIHVTDHQTDSNSTSGLTLFGWQTWWAPASAVASATGFQGSHGRDLIVNRSDVSALATAQATNSATEISLFDFSLFAAPTRAGAYATGIDARAGSDVVINEGSIGATATASAGVSEIGLDIADAAFGNTRIDAIASATGIQGGPGRDTIINAGSIAVSATSEADVSEIGVKFMDMATGRGELRATSRADGMNGACEADILANAGAMTVEATARVPDADTFRLMNLVDVSRAYFSLETDSTAVGMSGGGGADVLVNRETGSLAVKARSEVDTTSVEVNIIDVSSGDTSLHAVARAKGMGGGHGRDTIDNRGTLAVSAEAESDVTSVNVSFFDMTLIGALTEDSDVGVDAGTWLEAEASGMAGGDGADRIDNTGQLDVTATTDVLSVAVSASSEGLTGALTELDPGTILASVDTEGDAKATGLDGGAGADTITNAGVVNVFADSYVEQRSANLGYALINFGIPTPGLTLGSAGTGSSATATGIAGGAGNDRLWNEGELRVRGDATAKAYTGTAVIQGLELNSSDSDLFGLGAALADSETWAGAVATGISGGRGHDQIDNTGLLDVEAKAYTGTGSLSLNVLPNVTGILAVGVSLADTSSHAESTAVGIDGGDGRNHIANAGSVTVDATSEVDAWSASMDIGVKDESLVVGGAALARSDSRAEAEASGILGGKHEDTVLNEGDLTVSSHSDVSGVSVTAELQGFIEGFKGAPPITVGASLTDTSTYSGATATGVETAAGADTVHNSGVVDVTADADATSTAVSLTVQGQVEGLGIAAALSNTSTETKADATGIAAGESRACAPAPGFRQCKHHGQASRPIDGDLVVNDADGEIHARALADAAAMSVDFTTQIQIKEGAVFIGGALSQAGTTSTASASAIDGGSGRDTIVNDGLTDAYAEAKADSVGVSVGIQGLADGAGLQAVLSDSSATATASAAGIDAGPGDDLIFNRGSLLAHTKTEVDVTDVSAELTMAETGLVAGAALSRSSSVGTATARGIDGGSGQDYIDSEGSIEAGSESSVKAIGVSVGLGGSVTGAALGAALSDSSATAAAAATAIDAGQGDDLIFSRGALVSASKADVDAIGVSVDLGVTDKGLAAGASLSDSSAVGTSLAVGIDGGEGLDFIWSESDIIAKSKAKVDATSVSAHVAGSVTGVALGAALSDSSATASAAATAIDAGQGDDYVFSKGTLVSASKTDVDATGVSVDLEVAGAGVAAGASLSDSSADGTSLAVGIDGGEGLDFIWSEGDITAKSKSKVDATSVGVTVSGSFSGLAAGAAVSDSSATAEATSTGIAAGGHDDAVMSTGVVTAKSKTNVDSTSVSINLSAASLVTAGGALSDSSATATSEATGIDGERGDDRISNQGTINASATTIADSTSVSVTGSYGLGIGVTLSDSSIVATSDASGIQGGEGNDTVDNEGTISAWASTDADATSVSVSVFGNGATLGDASAHSIARATGIDSGTGHDSIRNDGEVSADARSLADAGGASIGIGAGWASAEAAVESEVVVRGIDGGSGDDEIVNAGTITVGPDLDSGLWMSSIQATSFTLNLMGASEAESSLDARTLATGIAGGAGADMVVNEGDLRVGATSFGSASNSTIGIFGTSASDGTVTAETIATGVDGGDDADVVRNLGSIAVATASSMTLEGSSFTFFGTGDAGGLLDASTHATGISGGNGVDIIRNEGDITIVAEADLDSKTSSITPFGTSEAATRSVAQTAATGIDGGESHDFIWNDGDIDVTAGSMLTLDGSSFTIAGAGDAGGSLDASTHATGIAGGAGSDHIRAGGSIAATATSIMASKAGTTAIFGTGAATGTSGAFANALGVDGGQGNDVIDSSSDIDVTSSASLTLNSASFTFGGASATDGALTATTRATGIAGGTGIDWIRSAGAISVSSTSTLTARGKSTAIFGSAQAGSSTTSDTGAVGIDGGDGRDYIENLSSISVESQTNVTSEKSSFVFAGGAGADAVLTGRAAATGIYGGIGGDFVNNQGDIIVVARSTTEATGGTSATFGDTKTSGLSTAESAAVGIDVGPGDDTVVNTGLIDVTASLTAKSNNDADAGLFFFDGETISRTRADLEGYGIRAWGKGEATTGGYGDVIVNDGDVRVTVHAVASANTTAEGGDVAWFWGGDANTQSFTELNAGAFGIDADSERVVVVNNGSLDVTIPRQYVWFPIPHASAGTVARGGAGGTDADGWALSDATGTADAFGIVTRGQDNWVENNGRIAVSASPYVPANINADGSPYGSGDADAYGSAKSTARVSGITTEGAESHILNTGEITVTADPMAVLRSWGHGTGADGDGRTGGAWDDPDTGPPMIARATAFATGIETEGASEIDNTGSIDVSATARAEGSGDSKAETGGGANAFVDTKVKATATGIQTGPGSTLIANSGFLRVNAEAHGESWTWADRFTGGATAWSTTLAEAEAYGVSAEGSDFFFFANPGSMEVSASAFSDAFAHGDVKSYGYATADGTALGVDFRGSDASVFIGNSGSMTVSSSATAFVHDDIPVMKATANDEAYAMRVGDQKFTSVFNSGTLEVGSRATAFYHSPNDFTSDQRSSSTAVGVCVGDGPTRVSNFGVIRFAATADNEPDPPQSHTPAFSEDVDKATAWGAGIQTGKGDDTIVLGASSTGSSSISGTARGHTTSADGKAKASAYGVDTGEGTNSITNRGSIDVAAEAVADVLVHQFVSTVAHPADADAEAAGIHSGVHADTVRNYGDIAVSATSSAATVAWVDFNLGQEADSDGYGIDAGDGENRVENYGSVEVVASAVAGAGLSPDGGEATATAVGIKTGDGNDMIITEGTITTTEIVNLTTSPGTAIDSGGGDDVVILGQGSSTVGDVRLGSGDDALVWTATASLAGVANGDSASIGDMFVLGGSVDGDFQLSGIGGQFKGFELFHKQGPSTWTLVEDETIDWTVDQGTLAVEDTIRGTFNTSLGARHAVIRVNPTGTVRRDDGLAAVILNGGALLGNQGLVETTGGGAAVETLGSVNYVANSGDIRSTHVGVRMDGAANVLSNEGTVESTGEDESAVVIAGRHNMVINHGLISSPGPAAVRFDSAAGSTGYLVNGAGGVIEGSAGVAVQGGDGDDTVALGADSRTVGDVLLAGGDDTLVWTPAASLTGVADGESAPRGDTFVLGGCVGGQFDPSEIGVKFKGFEFFRKGGAATWTLLDDWTLDWTVDQGTLAVGDTITGTLDTSPGALDAVVSINPTGTVRRDDGLAAVILNGGARLDNRGLIWTSGGGTAVQALGNSNYVTNSGSIRSTGSAVRVQGNRNVFTNQGEVLGTGAGRTAVSVTGRGNAVFNAGLIRAEGGVAVGMGGGRGRIVNSGAIQSTHGPREAIVLRGNGKTLINSGWISAQRSAAVRFVSAPGSAGYLVNHSDGVIRSVRGMAIRGGDGNEWVENHGLVFGGSGIALDLGGGGDVLLVTPTSRIEGMARGGAGSDTLVLSGAGEAGAALGQYTGFEHLQKEDTSTWMLTGFADMTWSLLAGQLTVDGTLAGPGFVQAEGRLAGNGFVGGFLNEGTVAPGRSIGALTVLGDYEHGPDALLEIEGDPAGASDQLNITGRALLRGGTVEVQPESKPFGVATEYTILSAAGGVFGAFGSVTSSQDYLDPYLDYGPQTADLTLIRNDISFRDMGDTFNQLAVGTTLDANKKAMARGDFKVLMDEFLFIDAAQQRSGLDGLSGELHSTTARALLRTGDRFLSVVADPRLSADRVEDGDRAFWIDTVGFTGSVGGDGSASGAGYRSAGLAAGVEVGATDATRIGAAFGYSAGKTKLDRSGGGAAHVGSYHPVVYARHDAGPWNLRAAMGYTRHDIETERDVRVGSIGRRATASYGADQYSGLARAAYRLRVTPEVSVKPFGELRYAQLRRGSLSEFGAGSASLIDVDDERAESLRSVLGVQASWERTVGDTTVKSEFRAGWARELADAEGELTAALAGAPAGSGFDRFTVSGATEVCDGAVVGLGATAGLGKMGRAFLTYDGCLSGRGTEHGFVAGARIDW